MSNSGMVARIAGDAIGADEFLPNMGSDDFLLCLSRQALEASCAAASVQPLPKVRETPIALVAHFANEHFVHPSHFFRHTSYNLFDVIRAVAVQDDIGAGTHKQRAQEPHD